jgi:hypothetical protein
MLWNSLVCLDCPSLSHYHGRSTIQNLTFELLIYQNFGTNNKYFFKFLAKQNIIYQNGKGIMVLRYRTIIYNYYVVKNLNILQPL